MSRQDISPSSSDGLSSLQQVKSFFVSAIFFAFSGLLPTTACGPDPRIYDYQSIVSEFSAEASPIYKSEAFEPAVQPGTPEPPASPLSLDDAVVLALRNNPDRHQTLARVLQSRAMLEGAESRFWPRLRVYTEYIQGDAPSSYLFKTIDARRLPPQTDFNEPGWFENYETGIEATVNLFRGGRDVLAQKMAKEDMAVVTVRFFVGEDRERSLVKLHNKIRMNIDTAPPIVKGWVIKPVEIDDVPIVNLTLYSDQYGDYELRRISEELLTRLTEVENISRSEIVAGRAREIRILLDPERMHGRNLSFMQVLGALNGADASVHAGSFSRANREYNVTCNAFLTPAREVENLVVGARQGKPVYIRDMAEVLDGPQEPHHYSRIGFSRFLLDRQTGHPAANIKPVGASPSNEDRRLSRGDRCPGQEVRDQCGMGCPRHPPKAGGTSSRGHPGRGSRGGHAKLRTHGSKQGERPIEFPFFRDSHGGPASRHYPGTEGSPHRSHRGSHQFFVRPFCELPLWLYQQPGHALCPDPFARTRCGRPHHQRGQHPATHFHERRGPGKPPCMPWERSCRR